MRDSVTSELTRSFSFSVWNRALSIHLFSHVSISRTFRLVAITVIGVFSSWLASVMKVFLFFVRFDNGVDRPTRTENDDDIYERDAYQHSPE